MEFLEEQVRFVFLHWARCIALIAPLPVFGNSSGSRIARVALGIMIGTILAVATPAQATAFEDPGFGPLLGVYIVKESLLGYLMGYIALIAFSTMRVAGDFVGTEMGFNMASINDPQTGVNTQIMAHIFESIGLVLFFAIGSHITLIKSLALSFRVWPVTTFELNEDLVRAIVGYMSGIFLVALKVSAPVFVAMLIVGVALAILAKVAPQLQIMMFAFPVKIAGGVLLLMAALGMITTAMIGVFGHFETFLFETMLGG